MLGKPVTLLIVEDDEVDVIGIMRALESLKIANPTIIANDGIEALEHLRGENGREKITGPYIILLDINMPRMSGLEFLEIIRSDPALKKSIVFMLTTSNADQDIVAAYEHNDHLLEKIALERALSGESQRSILIKSRPLPTKKPNHSNRL